MERHDRALNLMIEEARAAAKKPRPVAAPTTDLAPTPFGTTWPSGWVA
jgi:hypothetical protein